MTSVSSAERKRADYLFLSDALKRLPGSEFERHRHPAVVLDRATGPDVKVWGWWAVASRLPCLLWVGEQGWSTAVVEPEVLDSEGYERVFWSHRVKLLDLSLANSLTPVSTLEQLELAVAAGFGFDFTGTGTGPEAALLWGIRQLRAARARSQGPTAIDWVPEVASMASRRGMVDEELARHALVPTVPKLSAAPDPGADAAFDPLVAALRAE